MTGLRNLISMTASSSVTALAALDTIIATPSTSVRSELSPLTLTTIQSFRIPNLSAIDPSITDFTTTRMLFPYSNCVNSNPKPFPKSRFGIFTTISSEGSADDCVAKDERGCSKVPDVTSAAIACRLLLKKMLLDSAKAGASMHTSSFIPPILVDSFRLNLHCFHSLLTVKLSIIMRENDEIRIKNKTFLGTNRNAMGEFLKDIMMK
mmetsp:Transcript_32288/g.49092  ORF Transcript_32288/g.49092 Transcript_32288/m.49092 type:complete len:207 (+) Transcript_32288:1472-2092(+)